MVVAKYEGYRIGQMAAPVVLHGVNLIIIDIGIITGWQIPDDGTPEGKIYKNKLITQLAHKCIEDYQDMTFAEIILACRRFAADVKAFGEPMHIGLLDRIIELYRGERAQVSRIEEYQSFKQEPQRIFTQQEMEDSYRETAQILYANFLRNAIKVSATNETKGILVKDGVMNKDESLTECFERHRQLGHKWIYKKVAK